MSKVQICGLATLGCLALVSIIVIGHAEKSRRVLKKENEELEKIILEAGGVI